MAFLKDIIGIGRNIVTIVILALLLYFGEQLLIHSGSNPSATYAGYGCFMLAGIIGVILFAYYLVKEHYEGLLKHYQNALTDISTARSMAETINKNTLTNSISAQEGVNTLGGKAYSREQPPTATTSTALHRTNQS